MTGPSARQSSWILRAGARVAHRFMHVWAALPVATESARMVRRMKPAIIHAWSVLTSFGVTYQMPPMVR